MTANATLEAIRARIRAKRGIAEPEVTVTKKRATKVKTKAKAKKGTTKKAVNVPPVVEPETEIAKAEEVGNLEPDET